MTERSHHHHEHNDQHNHTHSGEHKPPAGGKQKPIVSRAFQATSVVGNGLAGAFEMQTGALTTLSAFIAGLHDFGDSGTYAIQTADSRNQNLSEEKRKKRKKFVYSVLTGGSLLFAGKAGVDLFSSTETEQDPLAIYATGASFALTSMMAATLYRGVRRNKKEGSDKSDISDIVKHLKTDALSAGLGVGGVLVQKYGFDYSQSMSAIVSGMVTAAVFRPTKENLAHDHSHGESHNDHHETDEEKHEIYPESQQSSKKKKAGRIKKATAALSTVALLGGVALDVNANHSQDNQSKVPGITQTDTKKKEKKPQRQQEIKVTKSVIVKSGDTQWGIVRNSVIDEGHQPKNAIIHPITVFMASENKKTNSDPDKISEGQIINKLDSNVVDVIADAIENSPDGKAEQEFRKTLDEINMSGDSIAEIIQEKSSKIAKMKRYIKNKMAHM